MIAGSDVPETLGAASDGGASRTVLTNVETEYGGRFFGDPDI